MERLVKRTAIVWISVDNIAGDNGRNPEWRLTLLGACPPEFAPE
jgi:hypothetical protein